MAGICPHNSAIIKSYKSIVLSFSIKTFSVKYTFILITTIIFVTNGIRGAFTINTTIIFGFNLEIILFHNIVYNQKINDYVIVELQSLPEMTYSLWFKRIPQRWPPM